MAEEFAAAGATLHIVPTRRLTTSGHPWRWLAYLVGWPVAVYRLTALARRLQVDVIHSNSLHLWYGWAVSALLRRPHIWHAREIVTQSPAALRVERWLTKRFATRVIAISAAVAAQLDPANVTIVLDEPDPEEFSPERAGVFRRRIGIPDEAPVVGSVGRIDTWKGVEILLDAVAYLRAARPDSLVVIAGPPVEGKEWFAADLAARAAHVPGLWWLGPRTDIPELLADLDAFVLPSTEPEPFGLVVVEALASGVPVVATNAGGPVEILQHALPTAGRLVPPRDAAALGAAMAAALPAESSTTVRRSRKPLRTAEPPAFAEIFDAVLDRS
jgi:glycosyltransferase involved in cell wall biosynthesis